jgi:triacylglycerol lipase
LKRVTENFNRYFHLKIICLSGCLILIFFAVMILSSCSKKGLSIQKPMQGKSLDECVILIHGLARTLHSMDGMQERLTAAGYHTVNLGYPSTSKTIEEIAVDHFPEALQQCQQFQPSSIHFVSHSLGGIVLRTVFKDQKPEKMGRVVMLSPPNHGSVAADNLKDWWFYEWLNGPAGQQLTTDEASFPNQLGPVDYPVGIITGDHYYFFDFWLSTRIPGPDDGKVSVQGARLDGMKDFLVVHETHPFIMNAKYVQDETLYFLENGKFKHQKNPLPPVSGLDWFSFPSDQN